MVATASSQDLALTIVLVLMAALWTASPHIGELTWVRVAIEEPPLTDLLEADLFPEETSENITGIATQGFPSQMQAAFAGERHTSDQPQPAKLILKSSVPTRGSGIHDDHRRLEAARVRLALGKDKTQAFPIERELAHVKMDLGQPASALRLYEQASEHAETPADRLAVLSDMGEAHLRQGNSAASIRHLEHVLDAAQQSESVPTKVISELHERLGRAHHASTNAWDFGESHERKAAMHYSEALHAAVEGQGSDSEHFEHTRDQMSRLASGEGPTAGRRLRMPSSPLQHTQEDLHQAKLPLSARVRSLIDELLPEEAEAEVFNAFEGMLEEQASGEKMAAALVLLGQVRRAQECYDAAAELYATALGMALRTTGGSSMAASDAYKGLSFCQVVFHGTGRPDDAVAIFEGAVAAADAAQIPVDHEERRSSERRLKANAHPDILQTMPAMQCRSSGKDSQVLDLVSRALSAL